MRGLITNKNIKFKSIYKSSAIVFILLFILFSITSAKINQDSNQSFAEREAQEKEQIHKTGGFTEPDWVGMFYSDTPVFEIILRGTIMYLGLFILLRVVLKRESGTVGMTDLLVIVLLADASQNAMASNYKSITDGLILVITIILWSHILNFLGYYFPSFQKLIHPQPLLLVKDGKIVKHNLRKEFLTEDELFSQIREQGVSSIENVSMAFMEMDGRISVIESKGKSKGSPRKEGF